MHSRLEQYLQTVEKNLSALSDEERENESREIRLHLESLVEANRELGSTEDEAVTRTLAQFGQAQTLSSALTHAHQSGGKSPFVSLAGTVAFNYFGGLVGSMVTCRLFPVTLSPSAFAAPTAWWMVRGLLTTVCVGWLTGAVLPRHAVKGTLYAHLLAFVSKLFMLLFLPVIMPMVPILSAWTVLLASAAIATSLAMFGARQGAQWRNSRLKTMRLAR